VEVKKNLMRFAELNRKNPKKTGEKPERIEVKKQRERLGADIY
jgi:hypothetical protein